MPALFFSCIVGSPYSLIINLAHNWSWLCKRRWVNLARSVLFMVRVFRTPNSQLSLHIISHDIGWIFLWSSSSPQKNFLLSLSNSSRSPAGNLMSCIVQFDIADITVWIRISLAALESILIFQPLSPFRPWPKWTCKVKSSSFHV